MSWLGIYKAYDPEQRGRAQISWQLLTAATPEYLQPKLHRRGSSFAYVEHLADGTTKITADLARPRGHTCSRYVINLCEEPASISLGIPQPGSAAPDDVTPLLDITPTTFVAAPNVDLRDIPILGLQIVRGMHVASGPLV